MIDKPKKVGAAPNGWAGGSYGQEDFSPSARRSQVENERTGSLAKTTPAKKPAHNA